MGPESEDDHEGKAEVSEHIEGDIERNEETESRDGHEENSEVFGYLEGTRKNDKKEGETESEDDHEDKLDIIELENKEAKEIEPAKGLEENIERKTDVDVDYSYAEMAGQKRKTDISGQENKIKLDTESEENIEQKTELNDYSYAEIGAQKTTTRIIEQETELNDYVDYSYAEMAAQKKTTGTKYDDNKMP